MSELKALKSALITSIVSVILCLAMLLGGTFAYFSSDVTGNVATIQTGYLSFNAFYDINNGPDQAMYTAGTQLSFVNVADSSQTLWVPGESYVLPAIYFSNLGNIKCTVGYELKFSDVDVDLLNVIDFKVTVDDVTCALPKFDGDSATAASPNGETVTVTLQNHRQTLAERR